MADDHERVSGVRNALEVRQGFWKLGFYKETFTKLEIFHKILEAFVQF